MTDAHRRSADRPPGSAIRPMRAEDLPACLDIFYAALDDLYERNGRPPLPRNPDPLGRLFGHLLETDPSRCHVAESAGGLSAFGIAHQRADTWFLSFLFVHPRAQAAGLGRELVRHCLGSTPLPADGGPEDGRGGTRLAVCAESIQPVSLALYASMGMRPRVPIFPLTGVPRRDRPLPDVPAVNAKRFDELAAADHQALALAVAGIDRAVLGYAHPEDHRFLARSGRRGWLFHDARTGGLVGYGYAQPSGRMGPVATVEPEWLSPVLRFLLGAESPTDGWQIHVPGPSPVLGPLLRAGLRIDDAPVLWCASSDGPSFDRYLVGSYAAL